jgi:hypothetical protein
LLLKASYVGNLGRHLDTNFNLNQAVPGAGAVNNRRPFFGVRPALADVTWTVSDGLAAYHAFQFSAEKRLTHGLSGLLSYTLGHTRLSARATPEPSPASSVRRARSSSA